MSLLQSKCPLDEDRTSCTDGESRTATSSKPLRIHVTRTGKGNHLVAFLYYPMFVESREKTFLCDWGLAEDNRRVLQELKAHRKTAMAFHIFMFPRKGVCAVDYELGTSDS